MNAYVIVSFFLLSSTIDTSMAETTPCGNMQEGRAYNFINKNYQCVADILSFVKTPGAKIITYQNLFNMGATNQQWYVKKVPGTTDNYFVLSVHDNQTIDTAGNVVTQQISTCSATQQFAFGAVPNGNGACYIYVNSSSSAMVLSNAGQVADCKGQTPLAIKPKGSDIDQQWTFTEVLTAQWAPVYPPCSLQGATPSTPPPVCVSAPKSDFSLNCTKPNSFYKDGACYVYYNENNKGNTYSGAQAACATMKSNLAVVRSADIAVKMGSIAKTVNPAMLGLWVQTPNTSWTYANLSGSGSSDGQYSMVNALTTNAPCKILISNVPGSSQLGISDQRPCNETNAYFCETLPVFLMKGCNETLGHNTCIAAYNKTKATVDDCGLECVSNTWCTGVNYNSKSQICEFLTDNTRNQKLKCGDVDWLYLERQ